MAEKNGVSLNWGGLDKAVTQAARRLADRKLLLNTIGETLVSSTKKRFEDGESPDGTAWEPSHRAQKEGGKTLADTGHLRDSINHASTSDTVMVGSNLIYARIHQKGGVITPKKGNYLKFKGRGGKFVSVKEVTIPARPYLGVSTADMEEVMAVMADFLADALRGK